MVVTLYALCCPFVVDSTETDTTKPDVTPRVVFELGSTKELTALYSYPNSEESFETLENTIETYLTQSIQRDLTVNGKADVTIEGDTYHVTITGDNEHVEDYDDQITSFLLIGKLGLQAVEALKKDNIWNEEEWRFFLPLGLSIAKQRSVQLLHFPPDYSLTEQDYLNSKTSKRWEKLLELNGVQPKDVTLYEAILDIAPIAAPASAGRTLKDTYTYFEPYVLEMLPLLLRGRPLPIVAYGSPVRRWVSSFFDLEYLGVNDEATVNVTNATNVPILGANHPSYIWYAKNDGWKKAFNVMEQDLVSACWQASMGANPSQVSSTVLQSCINYWKDHPMQVCINMVIQAYSKSEEEAREECSKAEETQGDGRKTEL